MLEQLGFSPMDRVVIVNADDFGISYASNQAIMDLFKNECITSASLMMPCAAANEAAIWCEHNKIANAGIHLTLTSSENYRYKPVFQAFVLDSLVNEEGYFHTDSKLLEQYASPEQVQLELRAQIELALELGVDVTHLDSHAGSVMGLNTGRDFLEIVFELCEEFRLPFNLPREIVNQSFLTEVHRKRFANRIHSAEHRGILLINDQFGLSYDGRAGEGYDDMKKELAYQLSNLKPWLSQWTVHPAILTEELIALTPHWKKREWEYRLCKDPEIQALFYSNNIHLVSWRAVRELQRKLW